MAKTKRRYGGKRSTRKCKCKSVKGGKRQPRRNKNVRKTKKSQRGGYGKGAGPVGYAWKACPKTWPGVRGGTDGKAMSNYYPLSKMGVSPLIPASSRLDLPYQKGGNSTFLWQDMVNGFRSAKHFLGGMVSDFRGVPISPNPLPYRDQLKETPIKFPNPPNVPKIYKKAGDRVAKL